MWLHAWVRCSKGGERACTNSAASAGSASVPAIAPPLAADAADADDDSVTSAGAAVISRLPEGVSSAASIHGSFRRCGISTCNSTNTSAILGDRFSCTCGRWVLYAMDHALGR